MELKTANVPKELIEYDQWVCWRGEKKDNGKLDKIPINPHTGGNAKTNDPSTWGSWVNAIGEYFSPRTKGIDGVGFVFAENGLFAGVDLDNCIRDGKIEAWAKKILEDFNSYSEVSPSEEGIKIFVKGSLPNGAIKTKQIEIYNKGRFFTVTGNQYKSFSTLRENQEALNRLVKKLRPPEETKVPPQGESSFDDNSLVDKILESQSGEKILRLLNGNFDEYPSQSEADQALCNHLAFWTGNNTAQIDRIFRTSGLMREKWDKKHFGDGRTYGQATIQKAIASTSETYSGASERHDNSDKQRKGPKGLGLDQLQNQYDSEVSWVWRQHFPFGLPVIVNGREGQGKTTICLRAAREILEQHPTGMVVWLATEGAVQDTVAKMVEQGLTSDRFRVAQKSNESFKWDFYLQGDRNQLEILLDELKPILCVFIDSIRGMSRLDDNDPKNGDLIHKINAIVCDRHRGGLVYIDHHGKGKKSDLLDKAVGTTAKTSSVRGVLSVLPVSKFKRVIKPAKANISSMGGELEVLKVGTDILIQEPIIQSDETMADRAEEFLINLFSQGGNMKATDVFSQGEKEGISSHMMKKAKVVLGIQAEKKGPKEPWIWAWPLGG